MFRFLTNRWLIAGLGLSALAALIWIAGPLIAIAGYTPLASETSRFGFVLLIVVIWAMVQLIGLLRARARNNELARNITEQGAEPGPSETEQKSDEERQALEERFAYALESLKASRLGDGRGRQYLYQLPWYIIIGPPGSGKTTALLNSGLRFPLADELGDGAVSGVGGTRNCDWWFTDEAVLLDTAGRYTTQDSYQAVDQAAWTGFLDLLKTHRRRRPINGALIAVSVTDLLQQTESERRKHAAAIRARIKELHDRLQIRFPIYVLLTKADRLAGFREFFEDLGKDERKQVWGMTFPMPEDSAGQQSAIGRFSEEMTTLEQRLYRRLTARLDQEGDPQRRAAIYGFPQQVGAVRQVANDFLYEIFQPSAYQETPLLRGIYLTSGTQEGSPIDRVMAQVANTLGVDAGSTPLYSGQSRGYFIHRLFEQVIFPEASLAGTNLKLERRRAWLQRAVYAGALVLTLVVGLAWFTSYGRNASFVQDVQAETYRLEGMLKGVSPKDLSVLPVVEPLNAARDFSGGYAHREEAVPLSMTLGLYQGDKLGEAAEKTYARLLREQFLPRLVARIEEQLSNPKGSPDYLFEALKVYLMLGNPQRFDRATVHDWIMLDWQLRYPNAEDRSARLALSEHLDALLEQLPLPEAVNQSEELISSVRQNLYRIPLARRVYQRLVRLNLDKVAAFHVSDYAGRSAAAVLTRASGRPLDDPIAGLYTYRGHRDVFLPTHIKLAAEVASEAWILSDVPQSGAVADAKAVAAEVRKLYYEDYIRLWDGILDDVTIVEFKTLSDAVEALNLLARNDSPLKKFITAVARETQLNRVPTGAKVAGELFVESSSGITGRLARLIQTESERAQSRGESVVPMDPVTEHFQYLHELSGLDSDGPPPIDQALGGLDKLYVQMSGIQGSRRAHWSKQELERSEETLQELRARARRAPQPLRGMLESVARRSITVTEGKVRGQVTDTLKSSLLSDLVPFCVRSVEKRYPLVRGAKEEISLEDFGRYFAPGGYADRYFEQHLKPYVDTSGSPWRLRRSGGQTPRISAETLESFRLAAVIRDNFFSDGADSPRIKFDMKPVFMEESISQLTLLLDGQRLSYAHGPPRRLALQWPGTESGEVSINLSPPSGSGPSSLRLQGPWAWFRVLERSEIVHAHTSQAFTATFEVGGRKARFAIYPGRSSDPFHLDALEKYQCPTQL